jgi:tetratricopeptide (TPR) repeat protein
MTPVEADTNEAQLTALPAAALAFIATGCNKLKARDNLNRGVQAFKSTQYNQAVESSSKRSSLTPASHPPGCICHGLLHAVHPGAESPENQQWPIMPEQFQKVLAQMTRTTWPNKSIASLWLQREEMDLAEQWYKKAIELNPGDKEAYYTLGVITWFKWYPALGTARAKLGMTPEAPPIKTRRSRKISRPVDPPMVNDGIHNLEKALDIDMSTTMPWRTNPS